MLPDARKSPSGVTSPLVDASVIASSVMVAHHPGHRLAAVVGERGQHAVGVVRRLLRQAPDVRAVVVGAPQRVAEDPHP